ncbi:Baculoviral IAP repeat-containing protein 7-B [Bulinus truncatus]|nr:Baculoviral IAP repeat-containing protein 7-B [Bulinus truncatus]
MPRDQGWFSLLHSIPGTYQPNEGTKLNVMIDNYSNDDSLRLININSTNGHQNKQTPVDPNTNELTGRLRASYDDCVRCYYCGGGLKNWKVEDNVWVEHARWFPKCTYIMRTVGPDFIKVVTELNKNHDQIDLTMVLAKLDADYLTRYPDITESPDKVQNDELLKSSFEKERILHNGREKLHKEPEVYTEQIKKTSGNNNILEGKQGIKTKIKIGVSLEDYEQFGVISDIPKKKEFKDPYQRLNAFKGWPSNHHLKPNILSEAGFYYTGQGDCTRCFWCGGGLRNWKDTDDVWVEHARWFPKCAYIRQKVGQIFIDAVQDYNRTHENITIEMVLNKIGRENMTCYQECLGGVKSANDELRDQTECKICLDKSVEIVFLPCGHLVSCTECAAALTLCPICRQEIQGRARAILS